MHPMLLTFLLAGVVSTTYSSPLAQTQRQLQQQYPNYRPDNDNRYPEEELREYETEAKVDYEEEDTNTIPGKAGVDYPILYKIPRTNFNCQDKLPGFYADEEAHCQVWHYCKTDGFQESFLCPNGTVYNQPNRVCEWWFNVQCEGSEALYKVNEDLYIIPPKYVDSREVEEGEQRAPPRYRQPSPQQLDYRPSPQEDIYTGQ